MSASHVHIMHGRQHCKYRLRNQPCPHTPAGVYSAQIEGMPDTPVLLTEPLRKAAHMCELILQACRLPAWR